ncbi:MAG: ArsR family transcriptional regulator [Puniceicoccaceae bacterium 5H]|nr:MAG: ArsR family transcriptional regulator [Puniceicoccaceae bacterium 5H]
MSDPIHLSSDESQEQLARQLWTLGDLNRLRILSRLPLDPDCKTRTNVSQLAEELGLSQPTVSNHLARLRTLGIVRCQRMCRDCFYWVDAERCEQIIEALQETLLAMRPGKPEGTPDDA